MMDASQAIKYVSDSLSAFFRHLLPGILILLGVYHLNPVYFNNVKPFNAHLWELVAISLAAGNILYVIHRYIVQQLIDLMFYRFDKRKGKFATDAYIDWLQVHVRKYYDFMRCNNELQNHITVRNSCLSFMYMVSELLILFTVLDNSLDYRIYLFVAGVIIFVASIWQNLIIREIEFNIYRT